MRTYTIIFKDRNKYEDVTLRADNHHPIEGLVCFVTFGKDGNWSSVNYALSEIFRIDECA